MAFPLGEAGLAKIVLKSFNLALLCELKKTPLNILCI